MTSQLGPNDRINNVTGGVEKYPFIPDGWSFEYAPMSDTFMALAVTTVEKLERDNPEGNRITYSIIALPDTKGALQIVEQSPNHTIHKSFCPRVAINSTSGKDYEYCPHYCAYENHSETAAILKAKARGLDVKGGHVYMGGHWWCCAPCWKSMIDAGISHVHAIADATARYDEKARRQDFKQKGAMRRKVPIGVVGDFGDQTAAFMEGLPRVGFEVVDVKTGHPEIIALLKGGTWNGGFSPTVISDLQNESSHKHAFTQLSVDAEKLF
jgi:deoxycytidylate deaminase